MTIAPVANFNSIIRHVGELTGGVFPGRSFNNQVINDFNSVNKEHTPILVGMGNALKIFISYEFAPAIGFTKVTINLYWIQRAREQGGGGEPTVPSGDKDSIIRQFDKEPQSSCNLVPFFDVIATEVASGSPRVDERVMNWQVIDLPLVDQPVSPTILPVAFQGGSGYLAGGKGVVYETTAKADELFLVSQVEPDNLVVGLQNRIAIDIAIGANAVGESK